MSLNQLVPVDQPRARTGGLFVGACVVGFIAACVFVAFPHLDIALTRPFWHGPTAFSFNAPGVGHDMRGLFRLVFTAGIVACVLGLIVSIGLRRRFMTLGFQSWLYVSLCLLIGPGLIANAWLKDTWGRPRPFHILQFGGDLAFTPVLSRAGACANNCSFVGGEAAAIFALFFALALLIPRRRGQVVALGCVTGGLIGFVRIAQGGHFISDIVFAGVFMAIVADILHRLVFGWGRASLAEHGPVHGRLALAARRGGLRTSRTARVAAGRARARIEPALAPYAQRLRTLAGGLRKRSPRQRD